MSKKVFSQLFHSPLAEISNLALSGYSLKRSMWWSATLINALGMAKIRSNLHTSLICWQPSLWPQPLSQGQAVVEQVAPLGHLTNQQVFLLGSSKKWQWTWHTHQWFWLQLAESNNRQGRRSLYFRHLLVLVSVATLPSLAALTGFVA